MHRIRLIRFQPKSFRIFVERQNLYSNHGKKNVRRSTLSDAVQSTVWPIAKILTLPNENLLIISSFAHSSRHSLLDFSNKMFHRTHTRTSLKGQCFKTIASNTGTLVTKFQFLRTINHTQYNFRINRLAEKFPT